MKTQISKPARERASYTEQYKQEALELWRASGRSAAKVAAELGIRPPLLYRWARLEHLPEPTARATSRAQPGELEAENHRLRAENAKLLEQREVLKKSLGILSEVPPRGMPDRTDERPTLQGSLVMRSVAGLTQRLLRVEGAAPSTQSTPGREHLPAGADPRGVHPQSSDLRQPTPGSVLRCPGRHNRIARLMLGERLFARQRSKYRHATTDSRHGGPIAPHRARNLVVRRPNQLWVSDATGVLTGQGWLYLVAVLDVFSRRVVGWAMSPILDAPLVSAALRMALSQRRPAHSLILHSDRGSQFASAAYRQLLAQHGLVPSMSRPGNCYDNAFIESFWSTLQIRAGLSPPLRHPCRNPHRHLRLYRIPSTTAPDFTPVSPYTSPIDF